MYDNLEYCIRCSRTGIMNTQLAEKEFEKLKRKAEKWDRLQTKKDLKLLKMIKWAIKNKITFIRNSEYHLRIEKQDLKNLEKEYFKKGVSKK